MSHAFAITVDVSYRREADGTFLARGRGLPATTAGRSRFAAEQAIRACLRRADAYVNALTDHELHRLLADSGLPYRLQPGDGSSR